MPFLAPLLPMIGTAAAATAIPAAAIPITTAFAAPTAGAVVAGATAAGATSIMSSLPMLLMSGSSLLEGFGQYQANKANAEISKAQAKQARLNAAYNERRSREESARLMGEQAARFGASGVAMEGTPLLVMADQARQSELDALAIRTQGKQASEGYKAEARGYRRVATSSLMGGLIKSAAWGGGAYGKYKGYY